MHRIRSKLVVLAVCLCVLAAAALVPPASASGSGVPWYQPYMDAFEQNGWLEGIAADNLQPDDSISRAQFASIVNRAAGLTAENKKITDYTDVPADSIYRADLAKALAAGYMNGDGGKFSPVEHLTLAETVTILYNAQDALGGNPGLDGYHFVLMNIPYAGFYAADVTNDIPVDAVSSATLNKTRTSTLVSSSYHVDSEGTDITGITFPVAVPDGTDLSAYTEVMDSDSIEITVTNRSNTSNTTHGGKDALFQNESYAYYELVSNPACYKVLTADTDGTLSFGKTEGTVQTLTGVTAKLTTETTYGDYQVSVSGLPEINTVYTVVLETKEGGSYGLRHLENVWRTSELAWCTGFTEAVHDCPTASDH